MRIFKIPAEVENVRSAVAGAAKKCRENRWDDVKEIAAELICKYDVTIEARSNFREARLTLEELEVQAKVDQALGQKTPNLASSQKTVEKTQTLLRAREDQLRITEQRAKQKYPDVFRFL